MQKGGIDNKQRHIVFSSDNFIPLDDGFTDIGGAQQEMRRWQSGSRSTLGDVRSKISAGIGTQIHGKAFRFGGLHHLNGLMVGGTHGGVIFRINR